jgi:hypothetical protein
LRIFLGAARFGEFKRKTSSGGIIVGSGMSAACQEITHVDEMLAEGFGRIVFDIFLLLELYHDASEYTSRK